MSDIKVYIVEDGALIRECLRAMLDVEQGIEVVGEAASAEQALQDLETLDVDLVLLDIGLPGMDGITAASTLKSRNPQRLVLMLTSHENGYASDALRAGASGYILKSSTREQLVRAIRTACDNQVPIDAAVAGDVLGNGTHTEASKAPPLTQRQVDVLKLAAARVPYRDIAAHLSISEVTVGIEMRRVFDLRPWLFRDRPTPQPRQQRRTKVRYSEK